MKIIYKIIIVISFFIIASCGEDRLDILPENSISFEDANKSESNLEAVKNAIYSRLSNYRALGANVVILGDLISDDSFVSSSNSGYFTFWNDLNYIQASNSEFPIDYLYDAYTHANVVLNTTLSETDNVKKIKAEAYVGRAISLFYLVNIYSPSIALGQNQEYGVPVYTGKYDPNAKYSRSTVAEVYSQIESDLLAALELFTSEPSSKEYFGPTAAKLLLSRVYLYEQKWQQAYNYAADVEINHSSSFDFITSSDFSAYFQTIGSVETVFELGYTTSSSSGTRSIYAFYSKNGGYAQNEFRKGLYELYDSSDVRKTLFTYDSSDIGGNSPELGYFTTKYDGGATQSVKILRLTEAKLNKIEAMYHLGNETQALSELNSFVATRGSYTYSSTGTQLLSDILKERRLEFAGEGHRFFDLKRNGLSIVKGTNYGAVSTLLPTDKEFVFPMPQYEMINNPKMTQYPGY